MYPCCFWKAYRKWLSDGRRVLCVRLEKYESLNDIKVLLEAQGNPIGRITAASNSEREELVDQYAIASVDEFAYRVEGSRSLFIPPPIEIMHSTSSDGGRGRRAYLMGESANDVVVDELIAYLTAQDVSTRRSAVAALGKVLLCSSSRSQDITNALQKCLKTESNAQVKQFADRALRRSVASVGALANSSSNRAPNNCPDDEDVSCSPEPSYTDVIRDPNKYVRGEQLIAWTFKTTSPMLIKGGAGSGKTIVAMLRAIYARKIAQESLWGTGRVVFLTYDKQLNEEIAKAMRGQGVDVMTVDAWVFRYLRATGDSLNKKLPGGLEENRKFSTCYSLAREAVFKADDKRAIVRKPKSFYLDEFSWIKGRGILSLDDYLASDRAGRGSDARLGDEDRRVVWELKEAYENKCEEAGLETFEDRVLRAWNRVETSGIPTEMQYDHVVVDEAQDFTYLKLKMASAMAKGDTAETKGITLIADVAQEIYQSGFSWKDADIAIRGRTRIFKRNYRNTRQIAAAAYSLLSKEESREEMTDMDLPTKEGPLPEVWVSTLQADQQELAMLKMIQQRVKSFKGGNSVVAVYQTAELNKLKEYFEKNGFVVNIREPVGRVSVFDAQSSGGKTLIHLRTLHHMKGLQFDHVFLWKLSEGVYTTVAGGESGTSLLRRLLYVGMTRACKTLTMCSMWRPVKFIYEIDRNLISVRKI